jgi:uncharacterized protein YlxP (DUF503 family)
MLEDIAQYLGLLNVSLHIPESQSLKHKRMVLKSLKERIKVRFNVSLSEVEGQDTWQTAVLAIAMVNGDRKFIDASFQKILLFIEGSGSVHICEQMVNYY